MTSECASCEQERPVYCRGLCRTCYKRLWWHGSLGEFGYLKADRLADYAGLRRSGTTVTRAADRLGVTQRTAQRYEAELTASGAASWRSAPVSPVRGAGRGVLEGTGEDAARTREAAA